MRKPNEILLAVLTIATCVYAADCTSRVLGQEKPVPTPTVAAAPAPAPDPLALTDAEKAEYAKVVKEIQELSTVTAKHLAAWRAALKSANEKEIVSTSFLLNAAQQNEEEWQTRTNKWAAKLQQDHKCDGCRIDPTGVKLIKEKS